MKQVLNYIYKKGVKQVHPAHPAISNWLFTEETEEQAILANAMAHIAEKNNVHPNELQHLFPAILRMLKDSSEWSK